MKRVIVCTIALLLVAPGAQARRHRIHATVSAPSQPRFSWDTPAIDLSPVDVEPFTIADQIPDSAQGPAIDLFDPPAPTPTHARIRNALLENGFYATATHHITPPDIRSRDLFVLDITQSLEGGFDSVNMYDRGIVSWGIMQWTAQSGSLAGVLTYIKTSLTAHREKRIWDKTFVANGIDVDGGSLVVYGKPVVTAQDARVAFRGTMKIGEGDPKVMTHWVTTFARAGRQGPIEQLEIAYAGRVVDHLLDRRAAGIPYHAPGRGGITLAELAGDDPYAEALIFVLWTNSPTNALAYTVDAARAARSVAVADDPSLWPPGAFADALLRRCARSKIGNWPARAAMIEARSVQVHTASAVQLSPFEAEYQTVVARRKQIRLLEVASRHLPKVRVAASVQSTEHPGAAESPAPTPPQGTSPDRSTPKTDGQVRPRPKDTRSNK
jgi:hypothetical protein